MSDNRAASSGSNAYAPVKILYSDREMRVYYASESELEALTSFSGGLDLAFLGFSAGAFITLAITLLTVDISDLRKFAAFVGITFAAAGFTIFYGVRTRSSYKAAKKILDDIKNPPPMNQPTPQDNQ